MTVVKWVRSQLTKLKSNQKTEIKYLTFLTELATILGFNWINCNVINLMAVENDRNPIKMNPFQLNTISLAYWV